MVFTISVKNLSYKQDLSKIDSMLEDQESTYVILKYATDIPDSVYFDALAMLEYEISALTYPKLIALVYQHIQQLEEVADKVFFGKAGSPVALIEED